MRYIGACGLEALLQALAGEYDAFGPVRAGSDLVLGRLGAGGDAPGVEWNEYRLPESPKPVFFPSGRVLTRWTEKGPRAGAAARPSLFLGAKACDVAALDILDRVLMHQRYREPGWCAARERGLVISGDCTACAPSCFCTMLGGAPHPSSHFDLNLSPVGEGYVIESGSAKGAEILERHAGLLRGATASELESREARRRSVAEQVREQNRRYAVNASYEELVERNAKTRIWGRLAATCVECSACNMVCPTCHCFMLLDRPAADGAERVSLWDSCFQAGFARMAGGGTPRLQLTERFRNHYYHKFVGYPRNWGVTACTGCGRCVDACMGRIDKRECLRRLEAEWLPSEVLEVVE